MLGLHQNKFERNHLEFIRQQRPPWHLVLDPSDGEIQAIKNASPTTKVIARYYERDSDVHNAYLFENPIAAGRARAERCIQNRHKGADANIILNEPPVDAIWKIERLAQFDIAFMQRLDEAGMKGCIGAFSGGNLQIPSIDQGAAIRAYAPAFQYAAQHGHYLAIHLYAVARPVMGGTMPSGFHEPKYYAFRWRDEIFPWMRTNGIPIPKTVVTEFGLDLGFARNFGYTGHTVGWRSGEPWAYEDSQRGAEQYANDLLSLTSYLASSPEVEGFLFFAAGNNGDARWESFMADGDLLQRLSGMSFPHHAQKATMRSLEFTNGANAMAVQTQVINLPSTHFSTRAGQPIKYIVVHSTATPQGGTVKGTANYLRQNDRKVSVHEFVSADTVYQMVSDDDAAHHCGSPTARLPGGEPNQFNNQLTWGIEAFQMAGTNVASDVVQVLLARVVAACRRLGIPASRVVSHAEIDPTRRSDPVGVNIDNFRADVAAALGESEVSELGVATWTLQDAMTAVWYNEQLARAMRGDNGAVEALIDGLKKQPKRTEIHNIIVEKALPPLEQERDKMPA